MTNLLTPSVASPAPVGTIIHWNVSVSGAASENNWYRFRARRMDTPFSLIRDYGPEATLDWTAADREGVYEVEASAMNLENGDTAVATSTFQMLPVATGNQPVVSPTANPLVFLYSAQGCDSGQRMRVEFLGADGIQATPYKGCRSGSTMNLYLAGLRPKSHYYARHTIDTGSQFIFGDIVSFTTGDAWPNLFTETVLTAAQKTVSNGTLLGSSFDGVAVAHALDGTPVWFCPNSAFITRPEPGGTFWGIVMSGSADQAHQTIRKFDLLGLTLLETNAARVNQQLKALGKREISAFHHEVRTLPGGRIAALAAVEQILTDVQGPGPVDVIGDMIVVFDKDLNVVWTWDTFDHLDLGRKAVLGETCANAGACAPHYLSQDANDWTHGNSLQQTADGNLLYSSRHQDWLIKVNYNFGEGDGSVLWKLGKDGDFRFDSADPYPWFSHQHDGNFVATDPSTLLVFDDGNTRIQSAGSGNSRGQAIRLDEQNRTATLVLNADLGVYSLALGSAQMLQNGDYHFDAGYVATDTGSTAFSIEVDPAGNLVYRAQANTLLYRSFRLTDIYSAR